MSPFDTALASSGIQPRRTKNLSGLLDRSYARIVITRRRWEYTKKNNNHRSIIDDRICWKLFHLHLLGRIPLLFESMTKSLKIWLLDSSPIAFAVTCRWHSKSIGYMLFHSSYHSSCSEFSLSRLWLAMIVKTTIRSIKQRKMRWIRFHVRACIARHVCHF